MIAVAQVDEEIAMPPKRKPGGAGGQVGQFRGGGNRPTVALKTPPGRVGIILVSVPVAVGPGGGFGQPSKPLTAEQVGLIRAWVDQGAK